MSDSNHEDTLNDEQRMQARWTPSSTVSVFRQSDKEYVGLLANCSETGLMVLSTYHALESGETFEIELVDIPTNSDNRRSGRCVVEVVWSEKVNSSMYGNGCRAIDVSDELSQMINSYRQK